MTITIKEVSRLLNLPTHGTAKTFSFVSSMAELCHFTGLRESIIQRFDQSIDMKFLFDRFALRDGFERHLGDFSFTSKAMWGHKRVWVYGLVMAEIYLFSKKDKKIVFELTKFMFDLFLGIKDKQCSIVPTILADIFVACTTCQRSENSFMDQI